MKQLPTPPLHEGHVYDTFYTHKEVIHMANNNANSNQLLVPGAAQALEQMKYEIASEFGVNLGPEQLPGQTGLSAAKLPNVLCKWPSPNWAAVHTNKIKGWLEEAGAAFSFVFQMPDGFKNARPLSFPSERNSCGKSKNEIC